jgi:probable F420-dependent oxidoreductase
VSPGFAAQVEDLGYRGLWVGGSPSGDLSLIESLLDATERIVVATGVVNVWLDQAKRVAASYRRIAGRYPGRFLLGVGVGHPEGIADYRHPYRTMVDYLDALDVAGVPSDTLVLAALGPRMMALSGQRSLGAHPYLSTPEHTRRSRVILGAGPLLAPEQKVVWGVGTEEAHRIARESVAHYLDRENYRNNLLREGWSDTDLADGGSDRLLDELVLHGDESSIVAGIAAHLAAGADHVCVQVLGDDPLPAYLALATGVE